MEPTTNTSIVRPWYSWKSPVGLGIFIVTAALGAAIILYTVLNLAVSISQAMHPQDNSGMSAQELQQLEQEQAPTSDSGAPATTGTAAQ